MQQLAAYSICLFWYLHRICSNVHCYSPHSSGFIFVGLFLCHWLGTCKNNIPFCYIYLSVNIWNFQYHFLITYYLIVSNEEIIQTFPTSDLLAISTKLYQYVFTCKTTPDIPTFEPQVFQQHLKNIYSCYFLADQQCSSLGQLKNYTKNGYI